MAGADRFQGAGRGLKLSLFICQFSSDGIIGRSSQLVHHRVTESAESVSQPPFGYEEVHMAGTSDINLDAELQKILSAAAERPPAANAQKQRVINVQPNAARRVWPWQVAQVPAYTSNGAS